VNRRKLEWRAEAVSFGALGFAMNMLGKIGLVVAFALSAVGLFQTAVHAEESSADQTWDYVRVSQIASDQLSLDVEVAPFKNCKPCPQPGSARACQQLHLVTKDMVLKDRLKQLQVGDRIKITFTPGGDKGQNVLKVFCLDTAPSPELHTRIWVVAVSAISLLLLCCILTVFRPQKLIIGEDSRYSNSKFQMALWFFVLVASYIATLWFRGWYAGCEFIGGVNIPPHLLLLSGMSVLTFGGAKAITTSKVAAAAAQGDQNAKTTSTVKPRFLWDLTHDDGKPAVGGQPAVPPQLDFGDVQMFVITLIAVATYVVVFVSFLSNIETVKVVTLPDVDTTILAVFGLGHGAYLTKKAVGDVGMT